MVWKMIECASKSEVRRVTSLIHAWTHLLLSLVTEPQEPVTEGEPRIARRDEALACMTPIIALVPGSGSSRFR